MLSLQLLLLTLAACRVDRQSTSDDITRIAIRRAAAPAGDEIDLIYAGQPKFGGDSIDNIGPDWVELGLDSFWQPIVEGFDQTIVSRTRVNVSPDWQVVSSGDVRDDGSSKLVTNTVPLPDVPFVAAPTLRITESHGNRVYDAGSPAEVVQRVLETASDCASYLNSMFPSHLPPLRIVLAPRKGPGYSRKNYIVITPGQDIEGLPLEGFLCHEEAHYWAIGAVASGRRTGSTRGSPSFWAAEPSGG